MLGLGSNLTKSGAGVKTIVTDNLVLKHNYDLSSVQPLSDGAAVFDGTDDYIDCGNGASLQIGEFDISYAAWVKSNGGSSEYIISKRDDSNGAQSLFKKSAGKLMFISGTNENSVSNTALNDGLWHHIAVVYDQSENDCFYYLDGVADGSDTSVGTTNHDDNSPVYIGFRESGDAAHHFDGYICNVGFFSAALTQAQIKSIMWKDYAGLSDSEETDLVSWWNLDSVIDSADSGDGDTTVYDNHHGGGDTLGDEILINGDFSDTTSTDTTSAALTGWTNGGTHNGANKFTISDGQLTCTTDGTDSYIASTQTLTLGVTYKLTLDYVSGDVGVSWYSGGSLGTISTVGTHTIYYTAVNTAIIIDNTTAGTFTVDNISVKLVNGNTGTLS